MVVYGVVPVDAGLKQDTGPDGLVGLVVMHWAQFKLPDAQEERRQRDACQDDYEEKSPNVGELGVACRLEIQVHELPSQESGAGTQHTQRFDSDF